MTNRLLITGLALGLLSACSRTDTSNLLPTTQGKFLILSNEASSQTGAGYLSTYPEVPTGLISNINANSLQSQATFYGVVSFSNWAFRPTNTAGEFGVQKHSVRADGRLNDEGFIKASTLGSYWPVSTTEGYYTDKDLGKLKIQKFNPTTMQRTGEIDLTANLTQAGTAYVSVGRHILAVRNGKLFADIYYSDNPNSFEFMDYKYPAVYLAVIDLATGTYEKTISYANAASLNGIGVGGVAPSWTLADDGALYFFTLGDLGKTATSKVIRIKAGATEFDQTWSLNMDDYRKGTAFFNLYVKNNTLYTHISTEAVKADFSNLYSEMWEYHAIDLTTKQATKVAGINAPVLFTGGSRSLIELNGQLYFRVINSTQKLNGYYVLDGNTAKPAFNLTAGGNAQDFQFILQ